MSNVERLISDLDSATLQMRDAAVAGDWAMVGIIQRHRALIIRRISAFSSFYADTDSRSLKKLDSIRATEAFVIVKGRFEKEMITIAMGRLKSGKGRKRMVRKGSLDELYGVVHSRN